ncbi:hypothetical protein CFOL_v3_31588 [Cephalotus follicularis]|uniref:Uncharacterized protein n=1 Tax=Cephalotus follicularis TaxID=3775 RepID=A0A1Q3D6T2_CEPFO|nr:hypothetical protein CFOL_v3_31588 [Cephalotus follicularis]
MRILPFQRKKYLTILKTYPIYERKPTNLSSVGLRPPSLLQYKPFYGAKHPMKHGCFLTNDFLPSPKYTSEICVTNCVSYARSLRSFQAKTIFDSISLASAPILEQELIDSIIDGLGRESKEFITSLDLYSSITFDEFYDLLLQEEHLIKKISPALSISTTLTTNHLPASPSTSPSPSKYYSSSNNGRERGSYFNRGRYHDRQNGNYHHSNYGGHRGGYSQSRGYLMNTHNPHFLLMLASINSLVFCQICNKQGHTTHYCSERGHKTGYTLMTGISFGGLSHIKATITTSQKLAVYSTRTRQGVWHAQLGNPMHANFRTLVQWFNLQFSYKYMIRKFHVCPLGKACCLSFSS